MHYCKLFFIRERFIFATLIKMILLQIFKTRNIHVHAFYLQHQIQKRDTQEHKKVPICTLL